MPNKYATMAQRCLSDSARSSRNYNTSMARFYDGVCGKYPTMIEEVVSAAVQDVPTLGLEFRTLSTEELCGARLLEFAANAAKPNKLLQQQMAAHANDEHRHSRMHHAILENLLSSASVLPVEDTDPNTELGAEFDDVRGFLISIHLAEIRGFIVSSIFRQQLELSKQPGTEQIVNIMDSIFEDEARHIKYTSSWIAQWLAEDKKVRKQFEHYIPIYDNYWWAHLETLTRSLSKSENGNRALN